MPRPVKCRRVCSLPDTLSFIPENAENHAPIVLNIDEFEAIRLIDKEKLSQEQCSIRMGVARTTVQKIYDSARGKIAEALVCGKPLSIDGGDYILCDGNGCKSINCPKKNIFKNHNITKGDRIMRIAVTYENGKIFGHFGHTEQFKVYDIFEDNIISSEVVDTNSSGHGALAGVLRALNIDILICGGIGGGAQMALSEMGIKLYGGVSGDADTAVEDFLSGKLDFDPNVRCGHHDSEHGDKPHTCGDHGCGSHSCGGHCGE